jgi:hypothetical protein
VVVEVVKAGVVAVGRRGWSEGQTGGRAGGSSGDAGRHGATSARGGGDCVLPGGFWENISRKVRAAVAAMNLKPKKEARVGGS